MDPQLKGLMKELGEAINCSVSGAKPVVDAMEKIRTQGYDVFLVLQATVGFNKRNDEPEQQAPPVDVPNSAEPELRITSADVHFLHSLRISFEEEDVVGGNAVS